MRDEEFLKQIGYLAPDQKLSDHLILPDLEPVDFVSNSGRLYKRYDYYNFLRMFGNACSHSQKEEWWPRIDFENVVKCLMGYRLLFLRYYKTQIPKVVGSFERDLMPIENYYIIKSTVPADQNRSRCDREFEAFTLDSRKNIYEYAIIRQYDKSNVDREFLLRNADVFLEASRDIIVGIPDGFASFRTIVGLEDTHSSFYLTAYLFRYEPKPLCRDLLFTASIAQRLDLCLSIAKCFANLHGAEDPIYHRLLTYDSIVVCIYKGKLVPYIIKFDFGKLTITDQYTTVFQQARQAEAKMKKENSLTKYLAPEWSRITDTKRVDWGKIDIFSLGVLFSDILIGRFDTPDVSFDQLEELELSDDVLDMIDAMISEDITARCELDYVQLVLQEELSKWK